jgi:CubicO group peptidase (beta-lactamase class C family)
LLDVRDIIREYSQALANGAHARFTSAAIHARTLSFTSIPEADWGSVLEATRARLDSLLTGAWQRDSTGGVVVGAIVGDSLIWTGAKGYADVRSRRPMGPAMTLRIGSITKQFTALMLLQLNDRARVALTDPVERFVPEARVLRRYFPNAPPVTLYQLATHTSGLAREPDDSTLAHGSSARWDTLVVRALASTPVTAEPGTSYRYSNIGYALLGLALSRAAGLPYEEYVTTHILRPLGMEHTGFQAVDATMLATGYDGASGDLDERQPAQEHQGRGYKVPNGALYTTVADMARFIAFETGGGPDSVLSRAVVDENLRRIVYANRRLTDAAGLGFVLVRDGELTVYGHGGTVAGYDAITGFDPERRLGVVILRNVSFGAFDSYGLLLRVMRVLRDGRRVALERPLH